VAAGEEGIPVTAYFHWTLADCYEWGSYEPRFGLYGVDRERGGRWSDLDSMGRDSAGAYRRLADGLRAGDRSVLTDAASASVSAWDRAAATATTGRAASPS
jgi:hypothetical protein